MTLIYSGGVVVLVVLVLVVLVLVVVDIYYSPGGGVADVVIVVIVVLVVVVLVDVEVVVSLGRTGSGPSSGGGVDASTVVHRLELSGSTLDIISFSKVWSIDIQIVTTWSQPEQS